LAVKDLEASRAFYEKFGFKVFAGDASQYWLIMKNGDHVSARVRRMALAVSIDKTEPSGRLWVGLTLRWSISQ